ncbi:MAG TPA: tRNA (adenosine(37)-N6)-threonylcarbamoyltransferase complex dimerization subunit type 1 TsaB [Steroidobacteraceae bacterium]|jgi:tRNA threonylcarbamoyladenosine biosynthesis protein TsaB|nr:tRNA (adenosine(37)-N6)-threonylcarbamoyltransferase complex dimerization subunit type 1 TsaB [Steroidobacteraceae bacterium]
MKILALDTSTEACSVSLGIGDRSIDRYVELERGHAEQLLPMVDAVLAEGGISLGSLDAIAFGRGPGGFTGVRLAASVAQGLAFGAELGVVPISDLAAVAQRVAQLDPLVRRVLVANDARMREVYWAPFSVEQSAQGLIATGPESVSAAIDVVLPDGEGAWAAAGRGLKAWPDLAERCRVARAALFVDLLPRASEVLVLARPQVAARQILDPAAALPVYVRDRVAESGAHVIKVQ